MSELEDDLRAARQAVERAEAALVVARRQRDAAIVRARSGGMTVAAIMEAVRISRRAVYIVLNESSARERE